MSAPDATRHRSPDDHRAEFDEFAAGYAGGMENPLKRLAAESSEDFAEIRAEWLLRYLRRSGSQRGDGMSLLDFGCGTATFLKALRRLRFAGNVAGCDVSSGMIEEARRTWHDASLPELSVQPHDRLPYGDRRFDIVTASAVFHHIPPADRARWYGELYRVLRPGGYGVIFEHNPWNPVTRWIVRHTPIDANAVLLSEREAKASLRQAGFDAPFATAILFFPPRLRFLRPLERVLGGIPLGGQYVAVGRRARA